jgi:transposase
MAKKKGSKRYYDEEFKRDVLRLVDEGRPVVEVAESLGLRPGLVYTWNSKRKREMGAVAYAASGYKELTPEEEIKALKEELVSTKRERDILKKALAIFSKEPLSH